MSGGTDDLGGVTSTVIGDSTIQCATLQDGTLTVASGETLTLDDVILNKIILSGGIDNLDGATSLVSGDSTIQSATLQDGTLTVAFGQALNLDGVTLDGVAIIDYGAINVGGVSSSAILTVEDGATITGDGSGTLTINTGSTLNVETGNDWPSQSVTLENISLINNGTLEVNGATLSVASTANIVGSGDLVISRGGTADFHSSFDENVAFSGTGMLELAHSYGGTISGFGRGDTIDLASIGYSPAEYAFWTQTSTANGGTGTLQIYNGDTLEETFHLNGTYAPNEFALTQDNTPSQGTDVNLGFISFYSDTPNTNGAYTPQISNGGNTLTLTNGGQNEYGSWFDMLRSRSTALRLHLIIGRPLTAKNRWQTEWPLSCRNWALPLWADRSTIMAAAGLVTPALPAKAQQSNLTSISAMSWVPTLRWTAVPELTIRQAVST